MIASRLPEEERKAEVRSIKFEKFCAHGTRCAMDTSNEISIQRSSPHPRNRSGTAGTVGTVRRGARPCPSEMMDAPRNSCQQSESVPHTFAMETLS